MADSESKSSVDTTPNDRNPSGSCHCCPCCVLFGRKHRHVHNTRCFRSGTALEDLVRDSLRCTFPMRPQEGVPVINHSGHVGGCWDIGPVIQWEPSMRLLVTRRNICDLGHPGFFDMQILHHLCAKKLRGWAQWLLLCAALRITVALICARNFSCFQACKKVVL